MRQPTFYEPRTIHDSSLSKAIHGIVNARFVVIQKGLTPSGVMALPSIWATIRTAVMTVFMLPCRSGRIWSGVIQGFAGLQIVDGELSGTGCLRTGKGWRFRCVGRMRSCTSS